MMSKVRSAYRALGLIHLVTGSVLGSRGSGAEGCVVVLCNVLVGFLGGAGGVLLGSLRDVCGKISLCQQRC